MPGRFRLAAILRIIIMKIRHALPSDYHDIVSAVRSWRGGRDLSDRVPRLFLNHFNTSSFVVFAHGTLAGFLIGFFSQSMPDQGYIHSAGVCPDFRNQGIGTTLYHRFFQKCLENDRTVIQAAASPVNTGAIAFHRKIGFSLLPGNAEVDGVPVTLDYNREGDHQVRFKIILPPGWTDRHLTIRQATINDVKLLSGIIRKSYQDVADRFGLTRDNCPRHPSNCRDEWIERDFIRGTVYYILEENSIPAGCAAIEQADSDICYLERLCVLPGFRENGYGTRLVRHIFTIAAALNARLLSIGIIAGQTELRAWYETFGFVEEQTRSFEHLPFKVTIMKALVTR